MDGDRPMRGTSVEEVGVSGPGNAAMDIEAESVSIIIPTLNAAAYIPKLAQAFAEQTKVPLEVLVIDSESTDATVEIARSLGWMTESVLRSEFDHGNTRNIGARLTSGHVIVFLSQDALPANADWLGELIAPLRNTAIGAAFSRQLPREEASLREKYARSGSYPQEPTLYSIVDVERVGIRAMFLSNVSSATKRSTFEEIGGFATRAILNEDGYFAAGLLQQGLSIAYVPTSEVVHSHDYSVAMQFRRYFDIGVSHADGPQLMRGAATIGAGAAFATRQLAYLVKERAYDECVLAVLDSGAKFVAYRLGRRYRLLPVAWRRRLGWNRRYWDDPKGR